MSAFLGAASWPISNIYKFVHADGGASSPCDEKGRFSGGKLAPYHSPRDYLGVFCGQLPKIAILLSRQVGSLWTNACRGRRC